MPGNLTFFSDPVPGTEVSTRHVPGGWVTPSGDRLRPFSAGKGQTIPACDSFKEEVHCWKQPFQTTCKFSLYSKFIYNQMQL